MKFSLLIIIFLFGCASVSTTINSTYVNISFSSNVDSAVFYGNDYCFTPCELKVERTKNIRLNVVTQGEQYDVIIDAEESWNAQGLGSSSILGNLLGEVITGAVSEGVTGKPANVILTYPNVFLHYDDHNLKVYNDKNEEIDAKVYNMTQ